VHCQARGVVIESRLDKGRGAVASVLVQQGTLKKGDLVLAGFEYGRVRMLLDENGKAVESAGPSIPVEILGLSSTPNAGDEFIVVADERRAREVALFRQGKFREIKLARQNAVKLENILQRMGADEKAQRILNIVLKADVQGSAEALAEALAEISAPNVKVKIISSAVGGINETDVNLAVASKAIIIGFNVRANGEARKLIEAEGIDVHYHSIIYDVIDEVKRAVSGFMAPEIQEKIVGLAEVREVFRSSKLGAIAGCMVLEGIVRRNNPIRVLRDNIVVFEGMLESLRRFKEDVSEVRHGMECGIGVKSYNDIKTGDQIEVFEKIEVKRVL
jgi:translation initiation factor IF-2